MDQKIKKIFWIIIILFVLLTSNILTRIKLWNSQKNLYGAESILHNCDSLRRNETNDLLQKQFDLELFSNSQFKTFILENEKLALKLEGKDKIVVYFNNSVCKICVLKILMDLDILTEEIGSDKIIIAGHFSSEEKFNDFSSEFQSKFAKILVGELKFIEDLSNDPVVFVIDKYLNIKLLYSPEKFPDIKKNYYKKILKTYFLVDQ